MPEHHRSRIARRKLDAINALYAVHDSRHICRSIIVELCGAERLARDLVHLDVDDSRLKEIAI